MKRILVDMDDVICVHGFINIVNDFLGTKYTEDDAKSYYINDLIPKEKMKEKTQIRIQSEIATIKCNLIVRIRYWIHNQR